MSAQILDGKLLAQSLTDQLKVEIADLQAKTGRQVRMATIMIGSDPAAMSYANSQKRYAEKVGIQYQLITLQAHIPQDILENQIRTLNQDPSVHGILLYTPVPKQINHRQAVECIAPGKDIEGLHAANLGRVLSGESSILPCTPASVMEILKTIPNFSLAGKEAVVVGRSEIFGKPVSLLLLNQSATVTICHSQTSKVGRLPEHVGRADVLVAAIGKPALIKGEWIKKGSIVIDVGINQVGDKIVGDVEFEAAKERAGYITPVPGGVGPLTVVMLMRNCVAAYKKQGLGTRG